MDRIRLDATAGRVSAELIRRGIPADTPVSVLVEIHDSVDLPLAALLQEGGAFDFLAEEPDLYTDADMVERSG